MPERGGAGLRRIKYALCSETGATVATVAVACRIHFWRGIEGPEEKRMATSVEAGSLAQFRSEAQAIGDQADWRFFVLLATATSAVASVFLLALLRWTPGSAFLWPVMLGWVLSLAAIWWTHRTRRVHAGIALLSTMMMVGISGGILVQRGSNAPALVYGLATVAVVLIASRYRLAAYLGSWLTAWTVALNWAAQSGRLSIAAPNPLGLDNARLLAFVVALVLIGLAARIRQHRRRGLDALLERALRLTEAERDEARNLAERRARAVVEIGHEIRTPMTGIVGAAQLLSQRPLSPLQRQLLSIQRQSAERLLQLVNAVLDEAKIGAAPPAIVNAAYAPRTVAAEVTELFAPRAHRKGVEIVWVAQASLPSSVLGDAMRVRQILSNLVSNALKFTGSGSVQVHLMCPQAARMRFEVRDTGRGIAPEKLEASFERFVSDAADAELGHGTGLGLPISRELARAMGGEISASSEPGRGSCFALDLPCVAAPADPADDAANGLSAKQLAERPREWLPTGRLWVVGASAPLELQLRGLLGELGVDARFLNRPPSDQEWADAGTKGQALMIDTWVGHGRCVALLPEILEEARRRDRRVIVVSSVAQDAAFGALEDVWQVFRPPGRETLREALAWAFDAVSPAPLPARPPIASRVRILLADDNPVNQIIGKVMLEQMGAEVVVVHGGQAALDESARRPFDLVLMDLQMPELDGLEATRRLRAHEQRLGHRRTPVVAVTGQIAVDIEAACRDAGVDEILSKPYTTDQLRRVVEAHTPQTTA